MDEYFYPELALNDITDDELMLLFADGNTAAFDLLFARHHVGVYNFACSMLNDTARAEEILQETFLAVVRSVKNYEPRGYFRTWLLRIARNRCLNAIESERLRRDALNERSLDQTDPPSREPSAVDRFQAGETLQILRRSLAQLPPRQREVMILYAFEQMTAREISQVLDMPINTVKTLVHRARAALATALDGEREKPDDL